MRNFNELLTEAAGKFDGWYSISVDHRGSEISISVESHYSPYILATTGWHSDREKAVRKLADQLELDSRPDGRYAKNLHLRQRFSDTANCLREGLNG